MIKVSAREGFLPLSILLVGICCCCLPIVMVDAGHPLKILGLFPHPGLSHFKFFHPIMRGLAEAGHDVTVVSHFPDKNPPAHYRDLELPKHNTLTNTVDLKVFENRNFLTPFVEFFLISDWGREACNLTLKSDAIAQVLRFKSRFDVILIEHFNTDCMMGVAHQLKAPVIGLSSCAALPWHYERMGIPFIPSYIPTALIGQSQEMSFGGRLANWFSFHAFNFLYNNLNVPMSDSFVRHKFGHDMPSVRELAKNTSLFFVNQHFSLSGVKAVPPSVIDLGGIHVEQAKPLDAELQRFLDNAEHGVVFISWGSMIRAETMPAAKREGILKAIKRLKQKVIWKWENETLANKPDNLLVSKWVPQRDILCHPNVKVFMTHGGLMGSTEAAYCGVPVVVTPMYGDQFLNAAALKQRRMGVVLQFEDISENTVIKAVKKALDKQSMDNAKLVSHSYKHRPLTALQTAIWWVEYVGRNGGAPLLKSEAANLSNFVYHSLDIYLFLVISLSIVMYIIQWIFNKLRSQSKKTKKIKNQ